MRHIFAFVFVLLSAAVGCELISNPAPPDVDQNDFAGFNVETLVEQADFPIAMAFLPNGNLLYGEKTTGQVRVVQPDGSLLAEPLVDFDVASFADEGLLGMAVPPDFATTGFLYFAMTTNGTPGDNIIPRNDLRIVRVQIADGALVADSETVLVSVPAVEGPGHEGGILVIGPDDKLYLTVGDRGVNGFPNFAAQDPEALAGRVLRYNRDGSIPDDNPFGAENPTFAYGLRNAFGLAFDPLSGALFATDNGPVGEDEIVIIPAGANLGWPEVSGEPEDPSEIDFIAQTDNYQAPTAFVGRAPTGIDFNTMDAFGDTYAGCAFFVEYRDGLLRCLKLGDDRTTVLEIETLIEGLPGGPNAMRFGPDGAVYVTTIDAVLRITPARD